MGSGSSKPKTPPNRSQSLGQARNGGAVGQTTGNHAVNIERTAIRVNKNNGTPKSNVVFLESLQTPTPPPENTCDKPPGKHVPLEQRETHQNLNMDTNCKLLENGCSNSQRSKELSSDQVTSNKDEIGSSKTDPEVTSDARERPRSHRPRTAMSRPRTAGLRTNRQKSFVNTRHATIYVDKDTLFSKIMCGDMTVKCPSAAKIVRIFTSSTFTDTEHERNALMERVYPRLREKCRQLGYEFQVVDMRWGVRDEATDDHRTTDLCLREIDLCMKLSTGPCFVTFLSHKYGYRPLPNRITSTEFGKVMEAVKSDVDKDLLNRWYIEDENSVPSQFLLQPISSFLPDFLCADDERRWAASENWNQISGQMKTALEDASREVLQSREAHRYVMSVTEQEIAHALFTPDNVAGRSAWFHRKIKDVDKVKNSDDNALCKYKDVWGTPKQVEEAHELLQDLRDRQLPVAIPQKCHITYNINWTNRGVDPEKSKEHRDYINRLCKDFETTLTGMIQYGIKSRTSLMSESKSFQEAVQHLAFCHEKCAKFHGRAAILKTIAKYISSDANSPLVIHGASGSGKTSVVAMAAKHAWDALDSKGAIVLRFIGTTPNSSSICSLLRSVITQIWSIYGHEGHDLPTDLKDLTTAFNDALNLAHDNTLVLLFDSLDQLDGSDNGRHLTWMPCVLPPHVRMIVSTLPDPQYECMPRLQARVPNRGLFVQVPKLPEDDASGILDKWLEDVNRDLTPGQRVVIHDAFKKCPCPLFLKLAFDEACRWRSYSDMDHTVLETTIRGCIQELFVRIERAHGRLLVSRALGYLTLSRSGLTESELEDILSCDDDVLNDVYMYWTPPIRRLPPLLIVRLTTELDHYLVDKGADGVRVFFWYHRQFIEAARERYCSNEQVRLQMHGALGDFFSGVWAQGKAKPYTNKEGKNFEANRHVTGQPLKFKDTYNLRHLNNLPFHRLRACQRALLKSECLCNFPFLQAKLVASGLRPLLDDFQEARLLCEDDDSVTTIGETLQLSQGALIKSPWELPSQFLGRIKPTKELESFLQQCAESTSEYLVASRPILTRPGGQLIHCLAGHKSDVTGLAMTADGKYAITCSNDQSLKIWDLNSGKLAHSVDGIGEDPDTIRMCCYDRLALVNPDGSIQAYELSTGNRKYLIDVPDMKVQFCVGGQGDTTLALFTETRVQLYRSTDGRHIKDVICPFVNEDCTIGHAGPTAGYGNYLATVDSEQHHLFVFNIATSAFSFKPEVCLAANASEIREEMLTIDAMELFDEGSKIVLSNMFKSELYIIDPATMTPLKLISNTYMNMSEKFHMTPDHRYLYFASHSYIVAWDLNNEERSAVLGQPTRYRDVVTADMEVFVTIGEEHVVKVWDLSREPSTELTSDKHSNDGFTISLCAPMENPRYVVVVGAFDNSKRFLKLHDVVLGKDIRSLQVDSNIQDIVPLNSRLILARVGRKLMVISLSKMAVTLTFQGKLPVGSSKDFCLIKQRGEVTAVTRGRKNIKLYSAATGKVLRVIKSHLNDKRIDYLLVNKTGTTLAAETEERCYLFYDLTSYKFLSRFDPLTLTFKETYIDGAVLTDDGGRFIFNGERFTEDTIEESPPSRIYIWNIREQRLERELTDWQTYEKFKLTGDPFFDTSVDSFLLTSSSSLLANLHDGTMRVYNINTGEITSTLPGHSSARLCDLDGSPYLLTRGTWTEDKTFRVLDRNTLQCIASYTPDFNLGELFITHDGFHFVGFFPNYPDPILWKLRAAPDSRCKPLSEFSAIHGETERTGLLALWSAADDADDPNDPDSDLDESEYDLIDVEDADFSDYLSDESF